MDGGVGTEGVVEEFDLRAGDGGGFWVAGWGEGWVGEVVDGVDDNGVGVVGWGPDVDAVSYEGAGEVGEGETFGGFGLARGRLE